MTDELTMAVKTAEASLRRRWSEQPPKKEQPVRYVVEFECTPSTFEAIKRFVAAQETRNRSFRFYAASSRKDQGEVVKEWQSPT